MPISYVLDKTHRKVKTTVTGSVTVSEILDHLEASRQEQILGYAELIDARGATKPYLTAKDVWRAADMVRSSVSQLAFGRRAVIVDGDVKFGLARMFTTLVADYIPIKVFRDEKEAEDWLGG